MNKEGCIILNKPFIGVYLDKSIDNEAHELINFFLDDKGNHFIYCNPYGQNVADAINKNIEYLIFTSATKEKSFYIEYIIQIEKTLHFQSMPKAAEKYIGKINNIVTNAEKEIEENIKEYNYGKLEDIKYGRISITELFTDKIKVVPVTFLAKKIYKVKNPIKIQFNNTSTTGVFDYNFQRNFGYVSEVSKNPNAYSKISTEIQKAIKDNNVVEELVLPKFNPQKGTSVSKTTFMDLISMFRQEECYTQILFKLFNYKPTLIKEFLKFIKSKNAGKLSFNIPKDDLNIKMEYDIKEVGRLDLYAYNDDTNIIIENKIDSGINFVTRNNERKDQLTRYYEYFRKEQKKENIYIVLAPNEKLSFVDAEMNSVLEPKVKDKYCLISYDLVRKFFNERKADFDLFEYRKYIDDCIELFRRLSLTRQEMCEENLLNNIKKKKTNP